MHCAFEVTCPTLHTCIHNTYIWVRSTGNPCFLSGFQTGGLRLSSRCWIHQQGFICSYSAVLCRTVFRLTFISYSSISFFSCKLILHKAMKRNVWQELTFVLCARTKTMLWLVAIGYKWIIYYFHTIFTQSSKWCCLSSPICSKVFI